MKQFEKKKKISKININSAVKKKLQELSIKLSKKKKKI